MKKNAWLLTIIVVALLLLSYVVYQLSWSTQSMSNGTNVSDNKQELLNICLADEDSNENECYLGELCGEAVNKEYVGNTYTVGQYSCYFNAFDVAPPPDWEGEFCTGFMRCKRN